MKHIQMIAVIFGIMVTIVLLIGIRQPPNKVIEPNFEKLIVTGENSETRETVEVQKETREEYLSKRWIPRFEDKQYKLKNFNYKQDVCTSEFRYPWNNERDIIITGGSYNFAKLRSDVFEQIVRALSINRSSAPKATIVILLINSQNVDVLKRRIGGLNITLKEINAPTRISQGTSGAVNRYYYIKQYLEENRNKYDRVIFGDTRDVVMFTDAFGMIDKDSAHFVTECKSNRTGYCERLGTNIALRQWMRQYPREIYSLTDKINPPGVNCGIMFGGVEPMLKVFTIIVDEIKSMKYFTWGTDTAVLNYLYYFDKFSHIPHKLHKCDNFVCFSTRDTRYDPTNKALYTWLNGSYLCSPVLIHQSVSMGVI